MAKWQNMTKNAQKQPKLPNMAKKSALKWLNMSKMAIFVIYDPKWPKWHNMAKYGHILQKIAKNDKK